MIKVKDRVGLVRDPNTGAIINMDATGRRNSIEARRIAKERDKLVKDNSSRLEALEQKFEDIESKLDRLLTLLTK